MWTLCFLCISFVQQPTLEGFTDYEKLGEFVLAPLTDFSTSVPLCVHCAYRALTLLILSLQAKAEKEANIALGEAIESGNAELELPVTTKKARRRGPRVSLRERRKRNDAAVRAPQPASRL